MKIKPKVITLVAGLFAILGAAQYLVEKQILLPSFTELERQAAQKDMDRVALALNRDLDLLAVSGRDWGNWADSYAYMQDHRASFIAANLTDSVIAALRVNVFAFVALDGHYVWFISRDLKSGQTLNLDLVADGVLPLNNPWQAALHTGREASGLLRTNQGAMIAVFSPVLNGLGQGPYRGMVLLGRLLTNEELARIGEQAKVSVARQGAQGVGIPAGSTRDSITAHDALTEVIRAFPDVEGRPALTLSIEVARTISARGQRAIDFGSMFLLGTGVIVLSLIILLLNRSVLSPLGRLTRHAVAIGKTDDLASRFDLRRSDELGDLAREFDRMLVSLGDARRQLVDRSFDAGIAENASGVLHNLGNAMTPLCVHVTELQQSLRRAPASDIEMLLGELENGTCEAGRRAGLETLFRLTSREVAETVVIAREEANAVASHTEAINAILTDQNQHSRADRVLETVRLPELIERSAELVPPQLRQRLTIELDVSLQEIGAVRLARHTLQQVFQNLIVNAAEAVHETVNKRGSLRIAARVIAAPKGEQLQLSFTDNGAGIRVEDLPRIFEKGFSTKPPATNMGIGLHWCSNVLNAAGGNLRAESAGPTKGTSLHVTMPLERAADAPIAKAV